MKYKRGDQHPDGTKRFVQYKKRKDGTRRECWLTPEKFEELQAAAKKSNENRLDSMREAFEEAKANNTHTKGDHHPDGSGRRFWQMSITHKNFERWVNPEKFEEKQAAKKNHRKKRLDSRREAYEKAKANNTYKYGDLHPDGSGRRFWNMSISSPNFELWVTPEKFEEKQAAHNARKSKRRATKLERLHPDHDQEVEEKLFAAARFHEEEFGEKLHVDHIVPLARGGWHWHENLRILPESLNCSKHAKLDEECPPEMQEELAFWTAFTKDLISEYENSP